MSLEKSVFFPKFLYIIVDNKITYEKKKISARPTGRFFTIRWTGNDNSSKDGLILNFYFFYCDSIQVGNEPTLAR